jgi:hypothetical protein
LNVQDAHLSCELGIVQHCPKKYLEQRKGVEIAVVGPLEVESRAGCGAPLTVDDAEVVERSKIIFAVDGAIHDLVEELCRQIHRIPHLSRRKGSLTCAGGGVEQVVGDAKMLYPRSSARGALNNKIYSFTAKQKPEPLQHVLRLLSLKLESVRHNKAIATT